MAYWDTWIELNWTGCGLTCALLKPLPNKEELPLHSCAAANHKAQMESGENDCWCCCFPRCRPVWSPPLLTELSGAQQLHPGCRALRSTLTFYHRNEDYSGLFFKFPFIVWQACDILTSQPRRCQLRHQNTSLMGKKKEKKRDLPDLSVQVGFWMRCLHLEKKKCTLLSL